MQIVHLIKTAQSNPHTAAIGDGGNDVSMIQEAHVGIGILGKEGRQASMSADFAFSKFMFLKKALLVHGHWYYLRISTLTSYFFYKNLVFTTPQVLFGIHNGFSAQVGTRILSCKISALSRRPLDSFKKRFFILHRWYFFEVSSMLSLSML